LKICSRQDGKHRRYKFSFSELGAFAKKFFSPDLDFPRAKHAKFAKAPPPFPLSNLFLGVLCVLCARTLLFRWQCERELAAFADFAFHPDLSAVQLDEFLGHFCCGNLLRPRAVVKAASLLEAALTSTFPLT
jgi:hypothetical protein